MSRVGIDAETGKLLYSWDHCRQSIKKILLTEIGERVQLRDFGSMIPRIIDRPQNSETLMDLLIATAEALEPRMIEGRQHGEPSYVLLTANIDPRTPGTVQIEFLGVYFENGHLGDYSNPQEKTLSFLFDSGGLRFA